MQLHSGRGESKFHSAPSGRAAGSTAARPSSRPASGIVGYAPSAEEPAMSKVAPEAALSRRAASRLSMSRRLRIFGQFLLANSGTSAISNPPEPAWRRPKDGFGPSARQRTKPTA